MPAVIVSDLSFDPPSVRTTQIFGMPSLWGRAPYDVLVNSALAEFSAASVCVPPPTYCRLLIPVNRDFLVVYLLKSKSVREDDPYEISQRALRPARYQST